MTSTRKNPRSAIDGDEQDVFTGWRRFYVWTKRPGATSKVKRKARRRERHEAKAALRDVDLTDTITIHDDEGHLSGAVDQWQAPNGTHDYRGTGVSSDKGTIWGPCMVCGDSYDHRDHGRWYRWCSYCGSIHPGDLLAMEEPEMMRSITIGTEQVDIPNVQWADWKYGYPHKMYVDLPGNQRVKFYARHLKDHPELLGAFNERFGYLGPHFGIDSHGLFWKIGGLDE